MLKQSLLYLSHSHTARRLVTRTPVSRRMAARFVAGDTLDEAILASRALNRHGLAVTLDFLGEAVSTREEALQAVQTALDTLGAIRAAGIEGNISLKLTQLGFDIDEQFCRENVERILTRGRELGNGSTEIFVRLDMESSDYTERTVTLVEDLWRSGYRNVGTVLQSYLRRTPDDLERLLALGSRVRLVKGAYQEPAELAFPDKRDVDRMFVEEMKVLLEAGHYPAIATQDEAMIDATRRWAFELGIPKTSYEFQMLYGVRRDLQQRLREEGYNVRVYVPFGNSWYPYLMRRLAERPANVAFLAGNVLRETPLHRLAHPVALGTGAALGTLATLLWRQRRERQ